LKTWIYQLYATYGYWKDDAYWSDTTTDIYRQYERTPCFCRSGSRLIILNQLEFMFGQTSTTLSQVKSPPYSSTNNGWRRSQLLPSDHEFLHFAHRACIHFLLIANAIYTM
jgi:hypothetical protein